MIEHNTIPVISASLMGEYSRRASRGGGHPRAGGSLRRTRGYHVEAGPRDVFRTVC